MIERVGSALTQTSLLMASVLFTVLMAGAVAALIPLGRVTMLALAAARRTWLRLRPPTLPPCLARHLSPGGELKLSEGPLRGDLGRAQVELAQSLRIVLWTIEPQLRDPTLWIPERSRGPWSSPGDDDLQTPIGLTGELWRWLTSAEAVIALEDLHDPRLEAVTGRLRALLLADGALVERLAVMLDSLIEYDAEVRRASTGGYRGLPGPTPRPRPWMDDGPARNGAEDESTNRRDHVLAEHDALIRAVARRYADDHAAREDLGQEIRLSVWRALPDYRADGKLRSYVLRIAHLCGARFARRQWRLVELDERAPTTCLRDDPHLAARRRLVEEAIESLPDSHREPLTLQLAGYSYREIGERLGLTESNVSARVSRARARLREQLG